jgi:tetratricopeptide (TPR) repeat protein
LGCDRRSTLASLPDSSFAPPPPPPASTLGSADQAILKDAASGARALPPEEVVSLSDRLLTEGSSTLHDPETLARLEILLLKTLKNQPKGQRARLMRNLGIIHFYNRKYKLALNEFQASNELNPKDARTHYYLARLYGQQGGKYQRQGQQKKSKGQFKLATMELELARKLEPSNPLYRQNVQQIINQDKGQ